MTDKEFKKHLKKLGIVFLLMMILMIVLSVYTLGSTKANLSIYEQSEYVETIKVLGLNEEELKQYLSVFGNLVDEEENEKVQYLNMATHFIDSMCSAYEVQTNENGTKCYDADVICQVIKEIKGEYIKVGSDIKEDYSYQKESNIYIKNDIAEQIPYCIQIDDITKDGDKIEITYQLAKMTTTQIADYMTGKNTEIETCQVKVTILNNTEYEYSKYFVSMIET